MANELTDDGDELAPEAALPESNFTLTPRMVAIAKGEDPDAIVPESETEDAPTEDTSVDEPEQAEVAEGESEPEVESPTSWVTADDRKRALAYGLDQEDLDAYGSREEFGRVTRALDKAWSRLNPTERTTPTAEPETKAPEAVDDTNPRDANGRLNLAYFEKNFDEATVELVREQIANSDARDKQNQAIESFRQEQEQQLWQSHVNEFHRSAESLRPDFFGRTVDKSGLPLQLSNEELDRRQKLWDAAEIIQDHMVKSQQRQNLPPSLPPWPQVLKQAEQLAFGDEIAKHAKAAEQATRVSQLKRVAAQSQKRRGVATTGSSRAAYRGAPPENQHSTEAILQHPDVDAVLRRIQDR